VRIVEKEVIMQIYVGFKNPQSGEIRQVKVGFSWVLFFFSGFIGLPLFYRGLVTWGVIYAGFWVFYMIANLASGSSDSAAGFYVLISLVGLLMGIFMGVKGNEITAKSLLARGWRVTDTDSEFTRMGLARWGVTDASGVAVSPGSGASPRPA
jgi:hypothetical protein